MRDIGSLGPAFTSRILAGRIRVKPAFALALYGGFLTRLSRPLGAPDTFSGAWRPTQTAHLPLSPSGLGMQPREGSVSLAPPLGLAPELRRLLPTLHTRDRTPATGCSKAPQGLRLRLGGTGLCASKSISPGSARGQRGSRWTIHASRQLSGKVLRYLKRVRVTPAVYGPFFRLNPAFRYPHWAGFSGNTHPYGLAAAYVFIKQSEPPSHCDLRFPKDRRHPFSRSYGASLPSSLGRITPTRLGLLTQGHLCQFSVRSPWTTPMHFSRAPGLSRTPLNWGAHHAFIPFSPLRHSGDFSA